VEVSPKVMFLKKTHTYPEVKIAGLRLEYKNPGECWASIGIFTSPMYATGIVDLRRMRDALDELIGVMESEGVDV
jgi:hypothetical protein